MNLLTGKEFWSELFKQRINDVWINSFTPNEPTDLPTKNEQTKTEKFKTDKNNGNVNGRSSADKRITKDCKTEHQHQVNVFKPKKNKLTNDSTSKLANKPKPEQPEQAIKLKMKELKLANETKSNKSSISYNQPKQDDELKLKQAKQGDERNSKQEPKKPWKPDKPKKFKSLTKKRERDIFPDEQPKLKNAKLTLEPKMKESKLPPIKGKEDNDISYQQKPKKAKLTINQSSNEAKLSPIKSGKKIDNIDYPKPKEESILPPLKTENLTLNVLENADAYYEPKPKKLRSIDVGDLQNSTSKNPCSSI